MRLLARVYADGPTPSKVSNLLGWNGVVTDNTSVVAELHETQIHGQVFVNSTEVDENCFLIARDPCKCKFCIST